MSPERRTFRTVSPRSGYTGDVMRATVEDGRLISVEGDPDDRIGRGKLSPAAQRYVERVYSPDRLTRPLRRRGEAGAREFEEIDWEDAIDLLAEALLATAKKHDPRALLHYAGHGHDGVQTECSKLFLSYYGGYSTLFGDLCRSAGMEATRLTFGALHHHPPEDYAHSGMVLLWGKNPAVTNPHQMTFLEEARAQGTRLVCIDPIRTETAALSDEHLAPRPGTDGFLAHTIAHVLLNEGLADKKEVARQANGFEDYEWLVGNYTPEKAEETCGIPADTIIDFARRFAEARPVNLNAGFGLQRYRNGGQTIRALAALQVLAGNIGTPGGGFDFFNQAAYVTRPFPFRLPAPPRVRQLGAASRFGRVVLAADEPPIRAAIIERANPMAQTPFTSAVHYALQRLKFVCVIDQFLTDTARRADLVLPAKSMFEELDLHPGLWHGVLHIKSKCIEPPGEAKSEREIYRMLADRLGYPTDQFDIDPEEMINRVLPPGLSVNRLSKQAFDRHGPRWIPFADGRFPTQSGRIELRSEAAEVSWRVDPLPFYTPPRESKENDPDRFLKYPLHFLTPKSEQRVCSQWATDPELREREDARLRIHPGDAETRGIKDGGSVRIFNDRGEIVAPAHVDDSVRPGVVALPQGRWISEDGFSVNVLTHDDVTDMGYGAIFFDCLVQVEPAEE
ncbi:MAG: molybdopterin-containing oxidoreductase family protein [Planctomycetota bacterium]